MCICCLIVYDNLKLLANQVFFKIFGIWDFDFSNLLRVLFGVGLFCWQRRRRPTTDDDDDEDDDDDDDHDDDDRRPTTTTTTSTDSMREHSYYPFSRPAEMQAEKDEVRLSPDLPVR